MNILFEVFISFHMAEQKTKPTEISVEDFIRMVTDEQMRDDSLALIKIMKKVTGSKPTMWGPSIIGFGSYQYKYESGHEGYSCLTGFSPRKGNISLYVMGAPTEQATLLKKLGKHKAGKGCLYVKKLADINLTVLEKLVEQSVNALKKKYPDK
jgi:hypothetical protein